MHVDYMVVGQGLAGSLLSYHLIEKGKKVLVFDSAKKPKASRVAAGIFNPFTGRKLVKTWMADELFSFLLDFYPRVEKKLGLSFFHSMPMYRPFLSNHEQNEWGAKIYEDSYAGYIDHINGPDQQLPEIVNPLGGMMMKQCGYVETNKLIDGISHLIKRKALLKNTEFEVSRLHLEKDQVEYCGDSANRVIFCEGPHLNENRFFNWLPMRPVKGELIEIALNEPLDYIANRGVFVLPMDGTHCKVGATFDNKNLDWKVTSEARTKLSAGLESLVRIPYNITNQLSGIRPATADRRPFIGIHPEFEPLAIFNGLGTKGVSLAPFLIHRFFELLENGKPLIPEVSISRYFSLYYNKI